jgi:hypothetical protein
MNRQGLTMRRRPWRIQKVNRLLSDPIYAGCFYFNRWDSKTRKERPKSEWIAVALPAIIDAEHRNAGQCFFGPQRIISGSAEIAQFAR